MMHLNTWQHLLIFDAWNKCQLMCVDTDDIKVADSAQVELADREFRFDAINKVMAPTTSHTAALAGS